jgi:hypothetical protein
MSERDESGIARVHGTERGDEIYVYVGERGKGGVCVFGSRYGDRPQAERVAHAINSTHERICPYRAERDAARKDRDNLAGSFESELTENTNLRKANEALREGLRGAIQHMRHALWCESFMSRHSLECDCGVPAAINALAALLAGDSEAERGD